MISFDVFVRVLHLMAQTSSQPTGKTVKTPVRKFVEHFRVSKQSESPTHLTLERTLLQITTTRFFFFT